MRMLASVVAIGPVAGHLNFDIPSFFDHALTACRAETGAFVAAPGTAVALDDVETDLRRAYLARPVLDGRPGDSGGPTSPLSEPPRSHVDRGCLPPAHGVRHLLRGRTSHQEPTTAA